MSFSKFISELKSVKHNFQLNKPFLFEVTLHPFGNPADTSVNTEMFSLLCHNANIPGVSVLTTPMKIYGTTTEIPYEKAFEPLHLSCYVDRDFKMPQLIQRMSRFNNPSFSPNFYDEYVIPTITLTMFDVSNDATVVAIYTIHNAVLKGYNSMMLDWSARNQIQMLTMSFSYEYYRTKFNLAEPFTEKDRTVAELMNSTRNNPMPTNWDTINKTNPQAAKKFTLSNNEGVKSLVAKLPLLAIMKQIS